MRMVGIAWIALLVALAIFAGMSFSSGDLPALLQSLPSDQQLVMLAIAVIVVWIVVATVWQARTVSQTVDRLHALESQLASFRGAVGPVEETQRGIEDVVSHVIGTGPEDAMASLHKRLLESESRTAAQEGQNKSADMQERLQDLRERQIDLRSRIGEVIVERRALEPTFNELNERQKKLESSLSELEMDDNRNSLFRRLEDFERAAAKNKERLGAVQSALASLVRLKADLSSGQAELSPLQAASTGVKSTAEEVARRSDELVKALNELEMDGDQKLSTRVDAFLKSKTDAEHRISLLEGWQETVETLRREFEALQEQQSRISRSISEAETDANGVSLGERIKRLNDDAAQTRTRLWGLQEALSALEKTKGDFVEMQNLIEPLKAADGGVAAVSGEVHALRDQLARTLDHLEREGDELLVARVEELRNSKKTIEQRIASLQDSFDNLDGIRTDVTGLFARLKNALNKHS